MNTFDNKFWWYFIPFLIFIIIILFFPYLFTNFSSGIDFSNTGNIGDTIGGILSPFISLAAAVLTFFAFWVQFKANEQQKIDLRIERFENKFYELLRLHKSNIEELKIGKLFGREVFVHLFYELKYCYEICESINYEKQLELTNHDLMDITYSVFFYGIGENSEKYYSNDFTEKQKNAFEKIKDYLIEIQINFKRSLQQYGSTPFEYKFLTKKDKEKEMQFYYLPFNGHVSHLSHYFIHLYQTANYIVKQDQNLLSEKQKYDYIKMLRSQLSNFEQLLMYYNSVSWFEEEWKEIFTKYRLIKNIPLPMCDFYITPKEFYKEEIENNLKKRNLKTFNWQ